MADITPTPSTTTTVLAPNRLSSSISLPTSVRRSHSHRIQDLVEYTHIPESAQINETSLPLLNPYNIFRRDKSLAKRVTNLVRTRPPPVKEYVQSTALDNCLIPVSPGEQYLYL